MANADYVLGTGPGVGSELIVAEPDCGAHSTSDIPGM
jgi:hypothetical protein